MKTRRYRVFNWCLLALMTLLGLSACHKTTVCPDRENIDSYMVPMYGVQMTPFQDTAEQQ